MELCFVNQQYNENVFFLSMSSNFVYECLSNVTALFARCFVLVMWVPPCLCIGVDWLIGGLTHVLWVPQVLSMDAKFQAWNQLSKLFTHVNIPIIVNDG